MVKSKKVISPHLGGIMTAAVVLVTPELSLLKKWEDNSSLEQNKSGAFRHAISNHFEPSLTKL